jgi:hypothetical protein
VSDRDTRDPRRAPSGATSKGGFTGHRPPATGHVSPEPGPLTPDPVLPDETSPLGLSWRALYGIVAATLAVLIALLALFTGAFE